MQKVLDNLTAQKQRHLDELFEFLRIPSISDLEEYKDDCKKAATWLMNNIKTTGFENARLYETAGHPIVYAEWLHAGADKPTVLVYGHYDVQPVDPLDLWKTEPFEPVIIGDKMWGRGTSDDKGQLFMHIKALEEIMKVDGKLPVNVKMIFEGEEEAGSSHLDEFIENHKELLSCDYVLISDTDWVDVGLPSICYSLRGLTFAEVKITGPNSDLHSGSYGGSLDNPANVLCSMIAKLRDEYGRVTIPGFYDDVLDLDADERAGFARIPFSEEEYCKLLGIKAGNGEFGYTSIERTWARPTLDINGMTSGFQGKGTKTIIPSWATAKISMRLVPYQDSDDIARKVEAHLKKLAPPTVDIEVEILHGGNPVMVKRDGKGIQAASQALKNVFNMEPIFMREGGSIPVVGVFQEMLGADSILLGMGIPGNNIHAPNENYPLGNFFDGIKVSAHFFYELAK
jgi:acetylornithine deacetylase/succinyl-diaminopimelate desuccinylase-like protein